MAQIFIANLLLLTVFYCNVKKSTNVCFWRKTFTAVMWQLHHLSLLQWLPAKHFCRKITQGILIRTLYFSIANADEFMFLLKIDLKYIKWMKNKNTHCCFKSGWRLLVCDEALLLTIHLIYLSSHLGNGANYLRWHTDISPMQSKDMVPHWWFLHKI